MKYNILIINIIAAVMLSCAAEAMAQERLSLSLSQCREMAIENSEDLAKASNGIAKAELDKKIAATASLPSLEGTAMGIYATDMEMAGSEFLMRGAYMAGLSVTQPIFAGGKIYNGRKMAAIGQEAAEIQEDMAKMDVLVEADNAYWTYIAVLSKVRMIEKYKAQLENLLADVETSSEVGLASNNDLLKVKAKTSEILYSLKKAENGADMCRLLLCRIIGADPSTIIEPTDTNITVTFPQTGDAGISERPELKLLDKQLEVSELQLKSAKGDLYPMVGLSLGYTWYGNMKMNGYTALADGTYMPYSQKFEDGIGMAMLSVQIPIFHWGETRKKVAKAKIDLSDASLDLQKNTELLNLDLQQAIKNLQDGYAMIESAEDALLQAEENLRVTKDNFAESMVPVSDVLDAQAQWEQARSNVIEAKTQFKIYETAYLRATGRLAL